MLEPEEVITKFHEVISRKYPNITYEEVNLICRAPFIFLRKQMSKLTLPNIRFKYWGVFKVKKGRIDAMPDNTQRAVDYNLISPQKLEKINTIINLKSQNDESN